MKLPLLFGSSRSNTVEGFKIMGHDSSYASIDLKKRQLFAFSTERITRVKHDRSNVLQFFNLENIPSNLRIAHSFSSECKKFLYRFFYEYFFLSKIRRILGISYFPQREFSYSYIASLLKLFLKAPIFSIRLFYERFFPTFVTKLKQNFVFYDHHLTHATSAYYFSPFSSKKSIVFILDGIGDLKHSSLWLAQGSDMSLLSSSESIIFNNSRDYSSIGHLYGLFTHVLGYRQNSDEGKTEALAAYGKSDYSLMNLCKLAYPINFRDLKWESNMFYVKQLHDRDFLSSELRRIGPESFARTIQEFLEDTVVEYLNAVYNRYQIDCLCISGGVAANVIMNLHIWERTPFKSLYVYPAMGDDGTSLGVAILEGISRGHDLFWLNKMTMPYWGPSYSRGEVLEILNNNLELISWQDINNTWTRHAATSISQGKIIGVFHGRMEFGPRALGNRSILADPRDSSIREKMNLKIKKRPFFQPFCPSVLESERVRFFQDSFSNKHMSMAFRFKEKYKSIFPSACHIDGTARPQFVEEKDNPNYFGILSEFQRLTGYGIVINTSFNLHGRAMVMSPKNALDDFLDCNLDELFIEGFKVTRK